MFPYLGLPSGLYVNSWARKKNEAPYQIIKRKSDDNVHIVAKKWGQSHLYDPNSYYYPAFGLITDLSIF